MYFAKWHQLLVYLQNHVWMHRKRGETPNTNPTNKPSNLTDFFFYLHIFHYSGRQQGAKESSDQSRMPAREQVCKLVLARDPFSSARRPGDDLGTERECCLWLGLSAWMVLVLNQWAARSKVWRYSNAVVKTQCNVKVVKHTSQFY